MDLVGIVDLAPAGVERLLSSWGASLTPPALPVPPASELVTR
jgi:hypothetical protein